jgi:hypothetical protein
VDRGEHRAYRKFAITKRSGGKRFIHVPTPELKRVQKWITEYILKPVPVHACSFAFSKDSSIYRCASRHTGAQWLIKMDITGFFESVSEIQVYRVFRELGYQKLVALELARISTVAVHDLSPRFSNPIWKVRKRYDAIPSYTKKVMGYLPQGAPTSPMLSNLVMRELDGIIQKLAAKAGLIYTRYSDDLTFSKRYKDFSRLQAQDFITEVGKALRLRLVAYCPYRGVTWSTVLQETKKSALDGQIPEFIRTLENSAAEIVIKLQEAERRAELERQQWHEQQERWRREEDRRQVDKSIADSKVHLGQIIQQWSAIIEEERFLQGIEARSLELPPADRELVLQRLELARKFLGSVDPLQFFLGWKTPTERYRPR